MPNVKNGILIYVLLMLAALSLRVSIARFLPNDDPEDGKVYAQIARNLLEHRGFSHATEPPYNPSLIRLPGYPLFLAAVYSAFGRDDNTSVRLVQGLIDTTTCGLVALIAFYWEPDPKRKRAASIAALALAALCPFTTIYVATILTETTTTFLAVAMCLTATLAFQAQTEKRVIWLWAITGLIGGLAVLFRPDSALFAAAIGITLVVSTVFFPRKQTQREDGRYEWALRLSRASYLGAVFSLAFCLVLVPWAIRNQRVFQIFQPLAPAHGEMPGEFVPRGYLLWLKTWLKDERDVSSLIWSVDTLPISLEDIPAQAFDSEQEKQRVRSLLELYNHPRNTTQQPATEEPLSPEIETQPLQLEDESGQAQLTPEAEASPSASYEEGEEAGQDEESDENDSENQDAGADESQFVAMTPEIDAGFAQIARERIARAPVRYYLGLPLKRAIGLWFNTHSQYFPFEGELFAPEGTSHDVSQQVWLPLFAALMWIYTFLGVVGGWFLWRSRGFAARRWLLLAVLIIVLRIGFFALLENPESRYVVELFPFVSILGGIAAVRVIESFKVTKKTAR